MAPPPSLSLPSILSDLQSLLATPTLLSSRAQPPSTTSPPPPLPSSPASLTPSQAAELAEAFLKSSEEVLEKAGGVEELGDRMGRLEREGREWEKGLR